MKLNGKIIENFHFYGHTIVFVFLLVLIFYGYYIKDYNLILFFNTLLIRPLNVITKKIFEDHKYYLTALICALIAFLIGYMYYNNQENKILTYAFLVMSGFQGLSILEYYINKFRKNNKLN